MFLLSKAKLSTHIIEFMSNEWIRNSLISFGLILGLLVVARFLTNKQNTYISYTMAILLFITSIASPLRTYLSGHYSIAVDLPLHLCGISAILCSVLPFIKRKQGLFDFVFYTGIIGGVMGILTPQMTDYDGSLYVYFVFYIRHITIFVMPIFMLQNCNIKLSKQSMFRTFLILNVLLVFIMPFNFYIGGNYMYLAQPPQVDNPLVIGEWPYYVIWFEVFVVLLLIVLYNLSKISFKKRVEQAV